MYFLKKHLQSLFFTLLLSCFALINCNAQVNDTRNLIKSGLNFATYCLTVYPNPADNQVMIKIPDNIPIQEPILAKVIFLASQSIVEEIVIDRYRLIDTSHYPNGSYIVIPLIPDYICLGTRFQVLHK